ncbi:MAG TPA: hypothetical protein VFV17_10780, partial [Usitatibacteraceae bacterium]|nr:hypothetical protein [Usitatibacteraceae bacterium]
VQQATRALDEIDGVTQRNASLVQEAAQLSRELDQQAARLERAVGHFELDARESAFRRAVEKPAEAVPALPARAPARAARRLAAGRPPR